MTLRCCAALALLAFAPAVYAQTPAPQLVMHDGHHALLVDGAPYLVLGAQINNSSAWPAELPRVWPALEAMHVNTAEAPVYWEQIEPRPGQWDWSAVDALLDGAREHHLHLVLLWFGTWKNGNDHYVPDWVKQNMAKYPRVRNAYGTPLDVLSPNSAANLDADRTAFTALMRHVAERDSTEHTVLMVQVENESGNVGSIRDYSPEANRAFAGQVPAELVKALGRKPGTWSEVFPGNADEAFQAWSQARYVNAIATAGKAAFQIPMYCNVWLAYPPAELPERHIAMPGIGYPSGGPVQSMLSLWKVAAPAIDAIGPDMYSDDASFYLHILDTYSRPDNQLWIPETGSGDPYAPFFFAALGRGAIGFSPFGIDWTGWTLATGKLAEQHALNYALLAPMVRTVAALNAEGKVKAAVEVAGGAEQELAFGAGPDALLPSVALANATVASPDAGTSTTRAADAAGAWVAEVHFGFPQRDGLPAPGTAHHAGRAMVAQLGPDTFLLTGVDASVRFHRPGYLSGIRMQIVRAEQGYFSPGATAGAPEVWHMTRLLNGDEDDRGIQFPENPVATGMTAVRITVGRF